MGVFLPINKGEVTSSGWLLTPLLLGPVVLLFVTWWQIYFTLDLLFSFWPWFVIAGAFVGWLLYKRSTRLIKLDIHPSISAKDGLPWQKTLGLFIFAIFITWAWVLIAIAIFTLPVSSSEDRYFRVNEVIDCTRKCHGCPTQVIFSNWVGSDGARFCADAIVPRARNGEQLLITGRFTDLVQYVETVQRKR